MNAHHAHERASDQWLAIERARLRTLPPVGRDYEWICGPSDLSLISVTHTVPLSTAAHRKRPPKNRCRDDERDPEAARSANTFPALEPFFFV